MASSRNLKVFGACLGSALIFWTLNALHQTYVTQIACPVRFATQRSKSNISKLPDMQVTLEVEDTGWIILRYLVRLHLKPVEIKNTNASVNPAAPEELLPAIKKQLKKIKINKLVTDSKVASS